jgi:hypothetical protein
MITFAEIEVACEDHRRDRDALAAQLQALEESVAALRNAALPGLRRQLTATADSRSRLATLVERAPALFAKPKTRVVHGIKVGFVKTRDALKYPEDEALVAAIRAKLPAQAETLIRVVETPVKDGLKVLDDVTLRGLGVLVKRGSDEVVVAPVDGELDKLVDQLLGKLDQDGGEGGA